MGDGRDIDSAGEERSKWRFLIDENLSPDIAEELELSGIEAKFVLDALFEGADDWSSDKN